MLFRSFATNLSIRDRAWPGGLVMQPFGFLRDWRTWAAIVLTLGLCIAAALVPPGPVGPKPTLIDYLTRPIEIHPEARLPKLNRILTSVTFAADGQRGWAVGQGGTILATTNGGTAWAAQTGKTTEDLNSVTFNADGQRGWALVGY